jgi:hypothetical protein
MLNSGALSDDRRMRAAGIPVLSRALQEVTNRREKRRGENRR